jgi:hypothetical protein
MINVRLSDFNLNAIVESFRTHFLKEDHLWLFGSRVDLSKKGGDIDLYVETHAESAKDALNNKMKFLYDVERKIGEQKIDVVLNLLNFPCDLPIYQVAKTEGIQLV